MTESLDEIPLVRMPLVSSRTKPVLLAIIGTAVLVVSVVVASVAGAANVRSVQPAEYMSVDYGYSVTFPGSPSVREQTNTVHGYQVTDSWAQWGSVPGQLLVVQTSAIPDAYLEQELDEILNQTLDGRVQATPSAFLVEKRSTELDGVYALEGEVRVGRDKGSTRIVVCLNNGVLYVISGSGPHWLEFYESFEFEE